MTRWPCLILLIFLAVAITHRADAQPCGSYAGVVTDAGTGEALPGANVLVLGKPGGTSTGVAGDFVIHASVGDTLRASFSGFTPQLVTLSDSCTLVIRLAPASDELQTVVIQSEKLIAEEFTIRKIRRLDIYNNPSAKADPILAVNATPSATTTDESANISLRGSTPAETGIFFNNVPINDAVRYGQLNGIGTFSIFNTALVNQVQVYPGNPPLEYGGTTSGMISLTTDETLPDRPTNTVSFTLASFGAYTARRTGKRSALTAFSNYQPSTFIKALNPKALERITNFESIDLGLHYMLAPSTSTLVKVFTYGIRESYQYFYKHPTYQGNFTQAKNRMYTVINFRKRFARSEFTVNNGFSFSYANYFSGPLDVNLWQRDFFGAVNYQHFGGRAEFKGGLTYDTRFARYQGQFPAYPHAFGEAYPTDSASSAQRYQVPEAYAYGKYFLAPRVTIGGGLRKNVVVGDTRDYLSYQLNVSYRPSKYVTINLSGGRYNKYQLPQDEQAL
ncbi:MAG: TonB-dependent receptor, partial [Cyclobacteriaceae bacterium]|nr:TonB-dependent receptor [Cyclobacteriaceae bacterium]